MKTKRTEPARRLAVLAALALLAAPLPAADRATNAPAAAAPKDYSNFKLISDRNIFNANRYGGSRSDEPPPAPKVTVVESFALLGTLDYEKGQVAFFEGSSASFTRACKPDETIGGCKIKRILADSVQLEADGKPAELKIGFQMRRENQGQWQVREWEPPVELYSSSSAGSDSRDYRSSRDYRDSRYSSSSSSSGRSSSGESPQESALRRIREQDKNGDGKISYEEADSRLKPRFRDMDRNNDGFVDLEEYTAYYASRYGGSDSRSSRDSRDYRSSSGTSTYSSPTTSSSSTTTTSSSGGDASEILKRLMQQREQENKK